MRCVILLLFALALLGCSSEITVRPTSEAPLLAAWKASLVPEGELSTRTQQTLRQLDLVNAYRRDPREVRQRLHQRALEDPSRDVLFALAEISYSLGRHAEQSQRGSCVHDYYCCAGYAYHYLFRQPDPGDGEPNPLPLAPASESVFDPRFRLACDLYNSALGKCIRVAQDKGWLDPRGQMAVGKTGVEVTHHGFAWDRSEFGKLMFCSDYEVVGMQNHFRTYGLGVALIGTRNSDSNLVTCHTFYPHEVSFPVTAFFRFEGGLAALGQGPAGRLELYNPLRISKITVGPRRIPLEADLTTPLAYFLSRTDLKGLELTGLLRAEQVSRKSGIYLFEPYQRGKIPVLMVHGLASSPLTWAPMFNELRADPVLSDRYQFWFYLYPSGNPYLATAAELRQALDRLRTRVDPQHQDTALDNLVVVGHSMGGLVSKLLTQSSGDDFWKLASTQPLNRLKIEPPTREALQRVFYFDQQPAVRRLVFLGTPHRGSSLSPSLPGRLASYFIRLPKKLMDVAQDLAQDNPNVWKEGGVLPTSIDLLSPSSPALQLLAARPVPPGVRFHSVIGELLGNGKDSSDGVVPYSSAHLEGAVSEVLVPAEHTQIHHHPRAVLEVRRILHEHLREMEKQGTGVVPASSVGERVTR